MRFLVSDIRDRSRLLHITIQKFVKPISNNSNKNKISIPNARVDCIYLAYDMVWC